MYDRDEEVNEQSLASEISGSYGGHSGTVGASLSRKNALSKAKSSTQLNVSGGDPTSTSDAAWRESLFRFEPHAFPSSLTSLAIFLPSPQRECFERAVKEVALAHHLSKSNADTIAGEKDGDAWSLGNVCVSSSKKKNPHSSILGTPPSSGQEDQ